MNSELLYESQGIVPTNLPGLIPFVSNMHKNFLKEIIPFIPV